MEGRRDRRKCDVGKEARMAVEKIILEWRERREHLYIADVVVGRMCVGQRHTVKEGRIVCCE